MREAACARRLGALLVVAAAAIPGAARAECSREATDLSWVRLPGAESCPAAARIRADVARRLGKEIGAPGEGRSIEVVVRGAPGDWSAEIHTRGCGAPEAVRAIASKAPTCDAIAEAATLVIVLAIDPEAALRPPAPPPAPRADPPPKPAPPPPPKPPAAPPARVEAAVTLRGLATIGLLPKIAPAIAWSAEWRVIPWLTVTSGATWLPEQRASDPTYSFGLTAGWIGACADPLRGPILALGPCARVLGGALHTVIHTTPAVTPTDPGARAWAGLGAGVRLAVRIVGPLRAEAGIDAIVPLTRHNFRLRDATEPIFRQLPVTGSLFAGAGVAFR